MCKQRILLCLGLPGVSIKFLSLICASCRDLRVIDLYFHEVTFRGFCFFFQGDFFNSGFMVYLLSLARYNTSFMMSLLSLHLQNALEWVYLVCSSLNLIYFIYRQGHQDFILLGCINL